MSIFIKKSTLMNIEDPTTGNIEFAISGPKIHLHTHPQTHTHILWTLFVSQMSIGGPFGLDENAWTSVNFK